MAVKQSDCNMAVEYIVVTVTYGCGTVSGEWSKW